jgi:Xaa-Pro aminopeptidase
LYIDEPSRLDSHHSDLNVTVKPYDAVFEDVAGLDSVVVGKSCNWALIKAAQNATVKASPIELEKAVKNETELRGFRECHVLDAAAVCKYLSWLQDQLKEGHSVDECQGADKLEEFRRQSPQCVGLSFDTISGSGPNGAVIHYKPDPSTCRQITLDSIYLLDSGGQYYSGTTDITRTVHLGNSPSDYERKCFTAVLKGVISLASAVFPRGTKGIQLDALARQHLWRLGLDYRHGTGHGVGHYLNVHEGPHSISYRAGADDADLRPGMVVTDEPGYYEDGKFGIRIENILVVVEKETEFAFARCLAFDTITLVPIQRELVGVAMLTGEEVKWLNEYHEKCWSKVSGLVEGRVKEWLFQATRPILID